MSELRRAEMSGGFIMLFVLILSAGCTSHEEEEVIPFPVSVATLRWHSNSVPERILELRGYYFKQTATGVPHFFSTEMDARMSNLAEAFPVALVPLNKIGNVGCADGYMKAFGYLDSEHRVFQVFVMSPYDADWEETSPCWSTSLDWQNDPELSHLAP